jgi:hypothetical protein
VLWSEVLVAYAFTPPARSAHLHKCNAPRTACVKVLGNIDLQVEGMGVNGQKQIWGGGGRRCRQLPAATAITHVFHTPVLLRGVAHIVDAGGKEMGQGARLLDITAMRPN